MNKELNAASASGDDLLTPCGRIPGSPLPRADYEMVALALAYGKKAAEACRMAGRLIQPNPTLRIMRGSSFRGRIFGSGATNSCGDA